ncbi:hypothetical protein Tco_1320913 [Tanacetum coccineum]
MNSCCKVIKAIHGPEGGLITDVRRGFRSTWTSIVQEVKKLQNQGVKIFDYILIKIGNGDNTSFWKDKWHNEGVLKDVFPRLSGVEEFQLDNLSRLVSTITLSSAVDSGAKSSLSYIFPVCNLVRPFGSENIRLWWNVD